MGSKYELAQYLTNLHTLLSAQDQAGGLSKSQVLLDEYNRSWGQLKDAIAKENENETRKR